MLNDQPADPVREQILSHRGVIVSLALTASVLLLLAVLGVYGFVRLDNELNRAESQQSALAYELNLAVGQLNVADESSCSFYVLISELPVVVTGPQRTTKSGVLLRIDARRSYHFRSCSTGLSPLPTDLADLARTYGISTQGA